MFDDLVTLDDVRGFITDAYMSVFMSPRLLPTGLEHEERLPLAVAEPGPLMVHAVRLAGDAGLTRQELFGIFDRLGKERRDRGLATLRAGGEVLERVERRPNRAGRLQEQVVFVAGVRA